MTVPPTPDSPAAPDRTVLDGIISDVERVADAKMWRDHSGYLMWAGETPNGNEIETEPPRVLLASALGALRALRYQGSPDYSTQAETAPGMIRNALQVAEFWGMGMEGYEPTETQTAFAGIARLLTSALAKLDGASGPPNKQDHTK